MLYGRDPELPTREMLESTTKEPTLMFMIALRGKLHLRISTAWRMAGGRIKEVQKKQKCQHDKNAKDPQVFDDDKCSCFFLLEEVRHTCSYKFVHPQWQNTITTI